MEKLQPDINSELSILHAGSLKAPLVKIAEAFKTAYPNIRLSFEAAGSVKCALKIIKNETRADLFISADYQVFPSFMMPESANWYINFARNQMVLVYTDQSRLSQIIKESNWMETLCSNDVRMGRTCSDNDPAGYRALMVGQLAELYYRQPGLAEALQSRCNNENIYLSSAELIDALKKGIVDYAFEYLSVARENRFNWIYLPAEINLSDQKHADFYNLSAVEVRGKLQHGLPIINAFTIPLTAVNPTGAALFCRLLLNEQGRAITVNYGLEPIIPAEIKGLKTDLGSSICQNHEN